MTRLTSVIVAIIVAFVSSPAVAQDPAAAQGMALTVSVPSAAVRKTPSVASPVVGQAPRGAVLDVTRDVGSWVKVTWPDAPDGVGQESRRRRCHGYDSPKEVWVATAPRPRNTRIMSTC